jgi:hypothetical protein
MVELQRYKTEFVFIGLVILRGYLRNVPVVVRWGLFTTWNGDDARHVLLQHCRDQPRVVIPAGRVQATSTAFRVGA